MEKRFFEAYTKSETEKESGTLAFESIPVSDVTALGKAERKIAKIVNEVSGEEWKRYGRETMGRIADVVLPRYFELELKDRADSVAKEKRGQMRRAESWLQNVFERSIISNPSLLPLFNHPEFGRVIEEKNRGQLTAKAVEKRIAGAAAVARYVEHRRTENENVSLGSSVILDASNQIDLAEVERKASSEGGFRVFLTQVKAGEVSPEEITSIHAAHQNYLKDRFAAMESINSKRAGDALQTLFRSASEKGGQEFSQHPDIVFRREQLWDAFAEFADDKNVSYSRAVVAERLRATDVSFHYFLTLLKLPRDIFEKRVNEIDGLFKDKLNNLERLRVWAESEPQTSEEILALHREYAPNSILTAEKFISRIVARGEVASGRELV